MKGLPNDLYILCKEVLLECEQFNSYDRLCSFCRGHEKLFFLNFKLKTAKTLDELYELNLPILLETEDDKYDCIFPLFLTALRDTYIGDGRFKKLARLCTKIQAFINQAQIPQKISSSDEEKPLFKLLLYIDLEKQEELVRQSLELQQTFYKKTAAFLVHGEEKFGQEALVTRLCQLPQLRNGRRIKIKVGGMNDISELWNEVSKHFSNSSQSVFPSLEPTIDKICKCLQTQNLIFILDEVNSTYIGFLPELIEKFWQRIVNETNKKNHKETYLVMFLVDNKGYVCKSEVALAWRLNQPEYPKIPLCLPPVSRFTQSKLQTWLQMAQSIELVPKSLCAETLLDDSQGGVPELVYQKICQSCNTSWEGKLAQWLIH